jgi:hypothetical protein
VIFNGPPLPFLSSLFFPFFLLLMGFLRLRTIPLQFKKKKELKKEEKQKLSSAQTRHVSSRPLFFALSLL